MSTEFEQVIKGLESVETSITAVQKELDEGKTSQKAFNDKLNELGEEQKKLALGLNEVRQSMDDGIKGDEAVKTAGQMVAEQAVKANFATNRKAFFEVVTKAAAKSPASNSITRNTIAQPYQRPGIITKPEQPLTIEGLFPHIPVSVPAINYLKEGAYTANVEVTAEGSEFKETTFTAPSLQVANVVDVGHYCKLTQQVIDDAAAYASYIDNKMLYAVNLMVDKQLITGTGSASQLPGIMLTANHTDASATYNAMLPDSGATLFDLALAIRSAMEQTWYSPEAFLLHPADWTALCMAKDAQGRYILGGPQAMATRSLWGVRVIATPNVPQGKFIMGNFTLGASIYDRQSLTVAMTDSDDRDFRSMIISVRVNRRLAFAVENPNAIYAGDFALPKA